MQALATLAKDLTAYTMHPPIPNDQREVCETLFYLGAACVIDFVHAIHSNASTPREAQIAFDGICREVRDFGIQPIVRKALHGASLHVIDVSASRSNTR
ncbi:hypothetical protein [Caballeronia sp. TF1N1]|uniref:hypothetical protein n=1 Tax=Caballeronia sp. TF1N1 TaxID=2878153 RepID=UPI001FD32E84|nr:hypothetical protein [Caballeronia sp. TF1N1]